MKCLLVQKKHANFSTEYHFGPFSMYLVVPLIPDRHEPTTPTNSGHNYKF